MVGQGCLLGKEGLKGRSLDDFKSEWSVLAGIEVVVEKRVKVDLVKRIGSIILRRGLSFLLGDGVGSRAGLARFSQRRGFLF